MRVERKKSRSFETPRRMTSAQQSPHSTLSRSRNRVGLNTDSISSPISRHTWSRPHFSKRATPDSKDVEDDFENSSALRKSSFITADNKSRDTSEAMRTLPHRLAKPTASTLASHTQSLLPIYSNYFSYLPYQMFEGSIMTQMTPQQTPSKAFQDRHVRVPGWNQHLNSTETFTAQVSRDTQIMAAEPSDPRELCQDNKPAANHDKQGTP